MVERHPKRLDHLIAFLNDSDQLTPDWIHSPTTTVLLMQTLLSLKSDLAQRLEPHALARTPDSVGRGDAVPCACGLV